MKVHELLSVLPAPDALRARCRALTLLEAVIGGYGTRYEYSPDWSPGVEVATMDNGSGDLFRIVFDPAGVFLYGFDHECDATPWREWPRAHWPGLLEGLPTALVAYPEEPAFQFEGFFDATVCAWRETGAAAWRCGPVEFGPEEYDGAGWLFDLVLGSVETVHGDLEDYYEQSVDREAVAVILAGAPIGRTTVQALNPAADFGVIAERARSLGYEIEA